MWFVFFAALILTCFCLVMYTKFFQKNMPKELGFFVYGITAVLVLTAVSELFFDFGTFNGAFSIMGIVAAVEFLLHFYLKKTRSRTMAFMGKVLALSFVLEMTLFQFPSYRLLSGGYEPVTLSLADAECENCLYDSSVGGVAVKGWDEVSLSYHDLDYKIGTVHVDVRFDDNVTKQVNFYADITEETGYYYRINVIEAKLIDQCPQSLDTMVQLAGKSDSARFRFSGVFEGDSCVIEGIELNRPIPFDVMPIRIILIVVLATFVYACIYSSFMKKKVCENKYFCRVSAAWITIMAICCGIILVLQQIPKGEFLDRFKLTYGDQITEELVTAFEKGHFYLDTEPTEELLAMENPYDDGTRFYDDIVFLWDHAFYEGKYYSYYGIAPLLLFVPYHLITGYFFPTDVAVMIFSSVGVLLLSLVYSEIIRKWFSRITTGTYISGLVIILAACGIWCSVGRPLFYELSISAGFMCFTAAAYAFIKSGIFDKGSAKLSKVAVSSLFMGLSVMCRPTLAVYAICGCLAYILNIGKQRKKGKSNAVPYLACAFLPIMALGLFQMYYNYARFGSILEFGIKYSLTINDFTHTEFHMHNMFIGLYNFLLAPPAFIPDYPFVSTPFSYLGNNSYYFKDEGTLSGILFLALPIFGYFLSGNALKRISDKKLRFRAAVIIGLTCVIMPVVVVCSAWESGYSARYMADFSWQIIIGAYCVLFYLYTHSENHSKKRLFNILMGLCGVYTLVVAGIESFVFSFPQYDYPKYANILDRLLAFYK